VVHDGREFLARLVDQVSTPVRWDLCQQTMRDLGVTGLLEVPPAGTLAGLARRELPGVETFALKTPEQLDDARAFVEKHGQASPYDASPTWRMVVAPVKGTFTRADVSVGDTLAAGAAVGTVTSLRDSLPVSARHGGTIVEWLVEDGDPVAPGQPLVRLHPEVGA
ncbi:MAG: biotin/lipoyl-containing protein, partial [Actinomycetota bacterium]